MSYIKVTEREIQRGRLMRYLQVSLLDMFNFNARFCSSHSVYCNIDSVFSQLMTS